MKKMFFIGICILLLAGCATMPPPPTVEQARNADFGKYPGDWQEITTNRINEDLIDPYSSRYAFNGLEQGWLHVRDTPSGYMYVWVACGTVNAKNRMGGYVGANPFYVAIRNGVVVRSKTGRFGTYGGAEVVKMCGGIQNFR